MKHILFVLFALLLFSCSDRSDALVGKWMLEEIDYSEHFKGVPDEVKGIIEQRMSSEFERIKGRTFFVFTEEQKLELHAPNFLDKMTVSKGEYRMNGMQDSVYFDIEIPESYMIVQLDDERLVLKTNEMPKRTLHLKKSKK
ncbi:MAG: hypothetical protein EP305_12070 [Bacteroidetes bacterium]|nr:MAG: hypothetical protein EP305_12070 [Bacteroidota bacterium]